MITIGPATLPRAHDLAEEAVAVAVEVLGEAVVRERGLQQGHAGRRHVRAAGAAQRRGGDQAAAEAVADEVDAQVGRRGAQVAQQRIEAAGADLPGALLHLVVGREVEQRGARPP